MSRYSQFHNSTIVDPDAELSLPVLRLPCAKARVAVFGAVLCVCVCVLNNGLVFEILYGCNLESYMGSWAN